MMATLWTPISARAVALRHAAAMGFYTLVKSPAMTATKTAAMAVMINAAERAVVTVDLIQARLATMAIRRLETVVPMLVKWPDAVMECREMICDPMKRDLKPVTMGMKVTAITAFVVVWWLAAVMVTPGWLVRNAMTVTRTRPMAV